MRLYNDYKHFQTLKQLSQKININWVRTYAICSITNKRYTREIYTKNLRVTARNYA
jgi:hypothetical protein